MPKFFVLKQDIEQDTLLIREDMHHILHVLRQKIGDPVTVCDGDGTDYHCIIEEIQTEAIRCHIEKKEVSSVEPKLQVTLCQGLPKAEKMEWIIQKSTEIGVTQIIPVETRRSVVRLAEKKKNDKQLRWNKIAQAAAKQSGRGKIPEVTEVLTVPQVIKILTQYERAVVLYEDEQCTSLKEVLSGWDKPTSIALLIGPEGGWDPREIQQLKAAGVVAAGLGPRILRTETAGPTAVAVTLYQYDEMA